MALGRYNERITVRISDACGRFPVDTRRLRELARTVCTRFGVHNAAISIAIVDSAEMRKVNREFLGSRRVTDVISFDMSDKSEPKVKTFDLVVNGQLVTRQAARRGIKPAAELALYVTHGLLHNLGFDDSTPRRAVKMHSAEDEILQHLGYGMVYNS